MTNEIMVQNDTRDFEIPTGYICTVDINTVSGKLAVMNALNGADSLSKHMNEKLCVRDIVTTAGVRSRTGETCVNTHLILADGTTLFSQSDGVRRSVEVLVALFTVNGVCDFGDGIDLMCVSRQLDNGNTIKTLVPFTA